MHIGVGIVSPVAWFLCLTEAGLLIEKVPFFDTFFEQFKWEKLGITVSKIGRFLTRILACMEMPEIE